MKRFVPLILSLLILPIIALAADPASAPTPKAPPVFSPKLKITESPNYIIHTDLDIDSTREAYIRMTRMFEEYQRRTAGFSGEIRSKFPFYLFKDEKDYFAAGGLKDSDGIFMTDESGSRLMAIAGEKTNAGTWHVVQHEGFHQFAHAVIRGELPPWINEGLAEYFGEAIFTGDGFVSGVISPHRLRRVQDYIAEKKFKPFREMFLFTQTDWNDKISGANYDQSWAMVHFLALGDDGKYQKAFVRFMNLIGNGKPYLDAWFEVFGRDVDAFQKRFEKWWTELPPNPAEQLYDRATILVLTSYLARTNARGQVFNSVDDFLASADEGALKLTADDYLPPSLLKIAAGRGKHLENLTLLREKGKLPQLSCIASDGSKLTSSYTLYNGHVRSTTVEIKPPTAKPATLPTASRPASEN